MVLKYKVVSYCPSKKGKEGVYARDEWNFVDGIIGARVYYDMELNSTIAELQFDSRESMSVALYDEASLLSENGKTIEVIKCFSSISEERSCSQCIHAHKVDDITYECDATEYDIDNMTCFVAKKEE